MPHQHLVAVDQMLQLEEVVHPEIAERHLSSRLASMWWALGSELEASC